MKKRWFCLSALLLAIVLAVSTVPTAMAVGGDAVTVSAPENVGPSISVWLEDGVPYYQITNGSETLVESSKLGLSTSLGELEDGFTMGEVARSSGDTTWKPVVGEQSQYRDYYNQASIPLTSNGIAITLSLWRCVRIRPVWLSATCFPRAKVHIPSTTNIPSLYFLRAPLPVCIRAATRPFPSRWRWRASLTPCTCVR